MKKLLVPFITAGFPNPQWFEALVKALDRAGADFIEIGVPFSDPIADGATIQAASQQALDQGVNASWILEEISRFRSDLKAALIFFSYYNPIQALGGLDTASRRIHDAGFHGVLIPDLALEQAGQTVSALQEANLHYIPLIAPTTDERRMAHIAPFITSFAYGVSVTGVTGARQGVARGLDAYLKRVRRFFDKPFVVGFGIATPEDAAQISKIADGVVVGSALIKKLSPCRSEAEAVEVAYNFIKGIRDAIDHQ